MYKIRKGDNVIVTTGKDKGKRGTVLSVLGSKVLVEGANKVKKHQKPNPAKGLTASIVEKEMPLDISNIALFNSAKNGPDRVGIKILEDGRKVRFFKSNGEVIDT